MKTAFVTGATGLLGNNLVRALVQRGVTVRALVRSREKALKQFGSINVDLVEGDMLDIQRFAGALRGNDVLFHTAAFFRDAYRGVSNWAPIQQVNVEGTTNLFEAAYAAGIRKFVHTSSVAVLGVSPNGEPADESVLRRENDGDEYYRSKIQADQRVLAFLDKHEDAHATMILPGWMFGPGDLGPTVAGQFILDFVGRKVPGTIDVSYSVVDARDCCRSHDCVGRERATRRAISGSGAKYEHGRDCGHAFASDRHSCSEDTCAHPDALYYGGGK